MKIKFFKKEKSFKKKESTFNLNLYWEIALFGASIMILSSFFFGYILFTQTNQDSASLNNNISGQVPTVSKDRFKKVLEYFSLREQKSADILNSPVSIIDPSL